MTHDTPDGVDLHLHTTASDGVLTPQALAHTLLQAGVTLCAITDHDTLAGLAEARDALAGSTVTLVPGVELSCAGAGRTLHVLGLGFDPAASPLRQLLADLDAVRRERGAAIAARLDRAGLPGSAILAALAGHAVVTRTHFARELARLGHVRDAGTAFSRWLAKGRPGYVPSRWPELGATVDAVRASGGCAVLAHPLRYPLSAGQRRRLVAEFAAAGGAGIEVVTGGQTREQTETAVGLCLRAGLEGSVGSDCHDPTLPWQRPGRLAKLPPAVAPIWRRWRAGPATAPASTA